MAGKPGALVLGGPLVRPDEWIYATQMDIDRVGNAVGVIMERDQFGNPTRVDLLPADQVTVKVRKGVVTYACQGDTFDAIDIWHERAHVIPGSVVGLSPIGAAAYAINQGLSAASFAASWFGNGAVPASILKNTNRSFVNKYATQMKSQFKASVATGDVLVLGKDWDYNLMAVPNSQASFIEAQDASVVDVCRYFSVPADIVDAAVKGSRLTYANMTQRHLSFLVLHLGPAVQRRERAFSAALPNPRRTVLDTDSLLRMDHSQLATMNALKIDKRVLTPDEWRKQDNLPPLTPDQIETVLTLFGKGGATPVTDQGDNHGDQPSASSGDA